VAQTSANNLQVGRLDFQLRVKKGNLRYSSVEILVTVQSLVDINLR